MKKLVLLLFALPLLLLLSGCEQDFTVNPHGGQYLSSLSSDNAPKIAVSSNQSISGAILGSSLANFVAQYGQPTGYSRPPLYVFNDAHATEGWPKGSAIIVTVQNMQAVEFSYDPGSDHPMTYQEAQAFAISVLPQDAQGPTTVQQENISQGKCLAKTYTSASLATIFPKNDFTSPTGKDSLPGTVTVNYYPDYELTTSNQSNQDITGNNMVNSTTQVNSVTVELGSSPSC